MFEQLHDGSLYFPMAGEILDVQNRCLEKLYDYNHTRPSESERRAALLREMFAELGEGCYIEQATLNGAPYTKTYYEHSDLLNGAQLHFRLSTRPNTQRGTADTDRPYSYSLTTQKKK